MKGHSQLHAANGQGALPVWLPAQLLSNTPAVTPATCRFGPQISDASKPTHLTEVWLPSVRQSCPVPEQHLGKPAVYLMMRPMRRPFDQNRGFFQVGGCMATAYSGTAAGLNGGSIGMLPAGRWV